MPKDNNNRMGWTRNLEALADGRQQYTVEYELGSECQIPGLLDYANLAYAADDIVASLWLRVGYTERHK